MEVPISKFRAELKHWLERARAGEELVITDHGEPIARVTGEKRLTKLEELVRDGVLTRLAGPRTKWSGRKRTPIRGGSLTDLISDMRGPDL